MKLTLAQISSVLGIIAALLVILPIVSGAVMFWEEGNELTTLAFDRGGDGYTGIERFKVLWGDCLNRGCDK